MTAVKWCKQNVIAALRISTVGAAGSYTHTHTHISLDHTHIGWQGLVDPSCVSIIHAPVCIHRCTGTQTNTHKRISLYECIQASEVLPLPGTGPHTHAARAHTRLNLLKGWVHPKMKMWSLSTHSRTDRNVLWSKKLHRTFHQQGCEWIMTGFAFF